MLGRLLELGWGEVSTYELAVITNYIKEAREGTCLGRVPLS